MTAGNPSSAARRRAFSLVELLTVIAIIGVVIAILVPTLSGARTIARSAATKSMMTNLLNASMSFENDNNRQPGYFPPSEMGSDENLDRGMSEMENILLDLAGGIVDETTEDPMAGVIAVGPSAANEIYVNVNFIGVEKSGSGGYFRIPEDNLVTQINEGSMIKQAATHNRHASSSEDDPQLPDLVDDFGNPILAWREDQAAASLGPPTSRTQFARRSSMGGVARFYYAQNSAFLQATHLGKKELDQTTQSAFNVNASTTMPIGMTDLDVAVPMMAMLGSPSFRGADDPDTANGTLAAAPRGSMIFQAAGPDNVYMAIDDEGSDTLAGEFDYSRNFFTRLGSTSQYTNDEGEVESIDVAKGYDDITVSGGN